MKDKKIEDHIAEVLSSKAIQAGIGFLIFIGVFWVLEKLFG